MNYLGSIKKCLKELLFTGMQKRIEQLELVIENNKEYLALTRKEHDQYNKLVKDLPASKIAELIEYSDTLNDIIVLQEKLFYTFGIRDLVRAILALSDE